MVNICLCMYVSFFSVKSSLVILRTGDIISSNEEEKVRNLKKTHTHTQNSQMVTEAQQQNSYVKKKKKILLDPMLFAFSTSPSP